MKLSCSTEEKVFLVQKLSSCGEIIPGCWTRQFKSADEALDAYDSLIARQNPHVTQIRSSKSSDVYMGRASMDLCKFLSQSQASEECTTRSSCRMVMP